MTIDEAEIVFGHRWSTWTEHEVREFVEALEPCDLNIPLTINWAMSFSEYLLPGTQSYLQSCIDRAAARRSKEGER